MSTVLLMLAYLRQSFQQQGVHNLSADSSYIECGQGNVSIRWNIAGSVSSPLREASQP